MPSLYEIQAEKEHPMKFKLELETNSPEEKALSPIIKIELESNEINADSLAVIFSDLSNILEYLNSLYITRPPAQGV